MKCSFLILLSACQSHSRTNETALTRLREREAMLRIKQSCQAIAQRLRLNTLNHFLFVCALLIIGTSNCFASISPTSRMNQQRSEVMQCQQPTPPFLNISDLATGEKNILRSARLHAAPASRENGRDWLLFDATLRLRRIIERLLRTLERNKLIQQTAQKGEHSHQLHPFSSEIVSAHQQCFLFC